MNPCYLKERMRANVKKRTRILKCWPKPSSSRQNKEAQWTLVEPNQQSSCQSYISNENNRFLWP